MATRIEIETALAQGNLWVLMGNGNYWRLRRNGKTQFWKTRPNEFSIPVKAGLRATGRVTHDSVIVADPGASGRLNVERI
jgi:hypothetical protein